MKNIFYFLLLVAVSASSCKKGGFLDDKTTGLTEEIIFTDSLYTLSFINKIYFDAAFSFDQNRFGSSGGNMELATDNAESSGTSMSAFPLAYNAGIITPSAMNATGYFTTAYGTGGPAVNHEFWGGPYANIRRVNIVLSKISGAPFAASTKKRIEGEVRFLRAWYYHQLVTAFAGVPLIGDEVFLADAVIQKPRNSYEECVSYLVSELDAAADLLNGVVYNDIDYGRATRGACLALKSRVLLYAASPLFNGGGFAGATAEQKRLIGYVSPDPSRWQAAAAAANAVINLGIYSLNIDNTTRPGYGFYKMFVTRMNPKYIFPFNKPDSRELETFYLPPSRAGSATLRPTHNLAQSFPMKDGKTLSESPLYNAATPYDNRDPRFYNTIMHNGMLYLPRGGGAKAPVETFVGATEDGYTTANGMTGYFSRKMLNEDITAGGTFANIQRSWPLIRYGEILLNYAEAINETGQTNLAYQPLKDLRERAGIEAGPDNQYGLKTNMTQAEMRTIIQNERRIELAFEEHRWNDIRRWKIAESVLSVRNTIQIVTRVDATTFTYATANGRKENTFKPAFYLLPIPLNEILKMPQMLQNPGY